MAILGEHVLGIRPNVVFENTPISELVINDDNEEVKNVV